MMMRVMSSTPPAVAAPDWAHTYFWAFLLFYGALFGGSRFPQGGTKVKELNYYIILLCHGDTQRELVKHALDPPYAFIYFLLSGLPFFGWVSPL